MGSYSWLNRWLGGSKANRPEAGALDSPVNRRRPDAPPVALVLLLRQPRDLDSSALARIAADVFGVAIAAGDSDAGPCVVGAAPHYLIQLPDRLLAVHTVALPY